MFVLFACDTSYTLVPFILNDVQQGQAMQNK